MVRFVFGVEDLARTRFAISPMLELVESLLALRDRETAAVHVPWLRSLSGRLDGIELERAVALVHRTGYMPDFLAPPPRRPVGDVEEDLAALRATPVGQIRHDMRLFRSQHPEARAVSDAWDAHPRRELNLLAAVLEAFWDRAVAPVWPRVREFLEADLAHRARTLAAAGPETLFGELHPRITWRKGALDVQVSRHSATHDLGGRGLLLMPSAFAARGPMTIDEDPWQPTVIYPARGIATLWEAGARHGEGLAALIGRTRAGVLADLAAPRSTTELAARRGLSPATTSHHLKALAGAGLVTSRREGRSVLYVRTMTGDSLCATSPA